MTTQEPGSTPDPMAAIPDPSAAAPQPTLTAPPPVQPVVVMQQQREGLGRVFGRSIIQALVWVTAIGMAFVLTTFMLFIVVGAAISAIASTGSQTASDYDVLYGEKNAKHKLLAIPVSGVIYGSPETDGGGGLFSSGLTYGYEVKQQLLDAADDDSIDGVVLVMNTPGGTIYGSKAIADGVMEYQKRTNRPVVAWVASLSASGGMYAMAPATRVLADHGTLIGSIGVRIGPFEYYDKVKAVQGPFFSGGVETVNGITYTEITAGRGKDVGSPYRPLTDEEKAVFQTGVNNSYNAFVAQVAEGRKLSEQKIREQIGALIYDELTAKQLGLIDDIAEKESAFKQTAELAKLRGSDWKVIQKKDEGAGLLGLLGQGSGTTPNAATIGSASTASCIAQRIPVAFYGDLAALCAK
ncbi:MAG: S49 family peptidase [Acidimicrobiia bacterium]